MPDAKEIMLSGFFAFSMLFLIAACLITAVYKAPRSQPAPIIPDAETRLMIATIEQYAEVRDAAISQTGYDLSLALIVGPETSEERARQLGDNFVRLVKSLAPAETPPAKEIGPGKYHYLVTVAKPGQQIIAVGAKDAAARRISW